jgi:hypothetical protein
MVETENLSVYVKVSKLNEWELAYLTARLSEGKVAQLRKRFAMRQAWSPVQIAELSEVDARILDIARRAELRYIREAFNEFLARKPQSEVKTRRDGTQYITRIKNADGRVSKRIFRKDIGVVVRNGKLLKKRLDVFKAIRLNARLMKRPPPPLQRTSAVKTLVTRRIKVRQTINAERSLTKKRSLIARFIREERRRRNKDPELQALLVDLQKKHTLRERAHSS